VGQELIWQVTDVRISD